MPATTSVCVIGAALDLGASRRGVDMGPAAIRYAGLQARLERLGLEVLDDGDVGVELAERAEVGSPRAHYVEQIRLSCLELADRVEQAARQGALPLILGGDHSIAAGSIAGLARVHPDLAVLWVDAHGDLNTPATSPSGNVHGMPLAALLGQVPELVAPDSRGLPLSSERLALFGVRSLDGGERELARRLELAVYPISDVDRRGLAAAMDEALTRLGDRPLHVSWDLDVVDPERAPGVGTPVAGGLTYREAHLAMEIVAASGRLAALDLVEVNPVLDQAGQTAALAVELAASALGARIL